MHVNCCCLTCLVLNYSYFKLFHSTPPKSTLKKIILITIVGAGLSSQVPFLPWSLNEQGQGIKGIAYETYM